MIINLTENQSYDLKFLEQYQASTAGNKITFHQELSQSDIDAIEIHINEMTRAEREVKNVDNEFNRGVDAELREIDLASIRSIREYIASKPDAPQVLKDHEANASDRRNTRKP